MARKAKAKQSAKSPVKAKKPKFDESKLSKGDQRGFNALRKRYGITLAEKWFTEHLEKRGTEKESAPQDKNAALIAETLLKLIDDGKIRIPRGGYLVTRGRGRVVVTRAKSE